MGWGPLQLMVRAAGGGGRGGFGTRNSAARAHAAAFPLPLPAAAAARRAPSPPQPLARARARRAGIISNLNAGVLMTFAWLAVVKRSGVSPLEGQWGAFLAIYAGLWVGASFMRPVRLSLALAAAPLVNAFMDAAQARLRVGRGAAFGLVLAIIAVSSFTLIFGTIAALGGFPNGVPPVRLPWAAP